MVLVFGREVNSVAKGHRWGLPFWSDRRLAVPDRRTESQAGSGVDDGVGVQTVVGIEIAYGAGLAELLNAQRLNAVALYTTKPRQRRRVTIDHGNESAIARQRR